ncbi:cupin domain-containing protein [Rugosimonospora acidiphila]|uniref:Cupin domain-containing protein n=1 Tax=Rugosimonospora acidiphila TaxID=556531 RepID=A0ABP9RPR3_9ACTN
MPADVCDLVERLGLAPHPEGGWYARIWESPVTVTPPGYPGPRHTATAIHFLLHPGEESRWHVVRSDELWLWHSGGPLLLRLGGTGQSPRPPGDALVLGPDLGAGAAPARLVPAGTWQSAAPVAGPSTVEPTLVTCVVSPGFDFADFRMEPPTSG